MMSSPILDSSNLSSPQAQTQTKICGLWKQFISEILYIFVAALYWTYYIFRLEEENVGLAHKKSQSENKFVPKALD